MEVQKQLDLISSIMNTKKRNGKIKKSKSTMTIPNVSDEMKQLYKRQFVKIFSDNKNQWMRWVDVSQTVVQQNPEMIKVAKQHNRKCLGPQMWTLVTTELIETGIIEQTKEGGKVFLRMI